MYAALDLGQKNIQVVLKNKDGKIIKENKIQRNTKKILEFIYITGAKGTSNSNIIVNGVWLQLSISILFFTR